MNSLSNLVERFDAAGNDVAVVSPRGLREIRTSYRQLAILGRRFCSYLELNGIDKGERVVIWGENSAEWVAAFFGCVLRGVLPVPLDAAGSLPFARDVAADVSPRLCVGDASALTSLAIPHLAFSDFASTLPPEDIQSMVSSIESDPLQIIFTSGTTGNPKGIVHTHGNVLASLLPIQREMLKYRRYERFFHPIRILHTLPLSHVFGQFMGLWLPSTLAMEVQYESRLSAREVIERIAREHISVLAAVPRLLDLMQASLVERFPDLQARMMNADRWSPWQRWWRFRDVHSAFGFKFWAIVCGGAALTSAAEQFWQRLGFVVVQGYGMTETTALISLNHPFRAAKGSVGKVLPGREVQLGDDGEVLVRGQTIASAIWQRGAIQSNASEWLHTGDLGEFDAAGNLHFRGRKKDVIVNAAGLNIHPADLESALQAQEGVKAAAVVETNTEVGPEPLAVLILQPHINAADVVQQANAELAEYQRIRLWQVWTAPDFPRTSTGKIIKREVSAQAGRHSAPKPDQALPALDSLGRIELQAKVEQQYGVVLTDTDLEHVQSQADLNRLVARGSTHVPAGASHRYWKWPWLPLVQIARTIFLETIAIPLLRLLANPTINRRPHGWPDEPSLVVCNHVTSYDAPFVLAALPRRIRDRTAIAMSGEMLLDYRVGKAHLLSPAAYWLITALFNVFPLPQRAGIRQAFHHAAEAIEQGYSVLIFPEGRRSEDGSLLPFQAGTGLLWKDLSVPLIPIYIHGLGELKRDRCQSWFRSGKISVDAGNAIFAGNDSIETLNERVYQAVLELARRFRQSG